MATGNIVNVCNQALLSIGSQSQISSLNEGSAQANACSTLFQSVFESLARSANWNCLRAQVELTLLAAAMGTSENPDGTTLPLPPVPYLYQYALPNNCLQVRFLVPSLPGNVGGVPIFSVNTSAPTWLPNKGQIPYVVAYATDSNNSPINAVLTNQSQAIAVYTVNQPNPIIWDSLFQSAMIASLAAFLVPALALNMPLMNIQIKIADKLIEQARTRDGNEGTTSMDSIPDWIRARRGASGAYWNYGGPGGYAYNYCAMPWPSY